MIDTLQDADALFPWFFPVAAFLFGAIVGSFLNVCIYRIPAKKSVVSPGSTCSCGALIKWYDNLPILSWFILRGKARCCGQPYSFRYPAIETLTGALFLFAWLAYPPISALCLFLFLSLLVCASFIDLDTMEIPDRFSLGSALAGITLSVIFPSLHSIDHPIFVIASMRALVESALGLLVGSGIILWLAISAETILRKEAMGFGDVKLLGGIGAFLGWQGAIFALFGGAVIGTASLIVFAVAKFIIPTLKSKNDEESQLLGKRTPFGPMLAAGAAVYALFLRSEVDAYFELIRQTLM